MCLIKKSIVLLIIISISISICAIDENHIVVTGFDESTNYLLEMRKCAEDGSRYALEIGAIYELQRNLKLEESGNSEDKTKYFSDSEKSGEQILAEMNIDRMKKQYPVAAEVYKYLHGRCYSDETIAGILGNMMAEVGGQTLNLNWSASVMGYYGVCMWYIPYHKNVYGKDLNGQLEYLSNTIENIMNQFNGDLEYFKGIKSPGEAAIYFCKYYERGSGRNQRARNAVEALKWINNKK